MLITQITSPLQLSIMLFYKISSWNFFIMHENIRSLGNFFDKFHSFASELSRAAYVIVFWETWLSANTCHEVQDYTGFHTYRADKTGGGVSVFIRNCYTTTHMAKFSVCYAYYEISVVKVLLSNKCTVIIIGVYRPPHKSKITEFTIKFNEILLSTSQSDHVFIVSDLNINLQYPIAIEMILLITATQTPSSLSSINPLAMLIKSKYYRSYMD